MQKICNFTQKIKKEKLIKTAFNKPIISVVTSRLGFEVGLLAARALPCWQVHPDALPWPSRALPRNAPRHSWCTPALALRPRQQDGASRAQGRVKLQTTPLLDIFLLAHPPCSVASLPPVTTSLPGMRALPESCGRAGLASEAIIKLQSSVTPRSKHVRQERCCGSSSTEWLETDISDGTSQRDEVALQRAPMTYVALQRTTVIMGCQDCEVSAMLQGIYFIYLSYYFNSFFFFFFFKWRVWVCQGTRGMFCKHGAREVGQPNLAWDMPQNGLQRCVRPLTCNYVSCIYV